MLRNYLLALSSESDMLQLFGVNELKACSSSRQGLRDESFMRCVVLNVHAKIRPNNLTSSGLCGLQLCVSVCCAWLRFWQGSHRKSSCRGARATGSAEVATSGRGACLHLRVRPSLTLRHPTPTSDLLDMNTPHSLAPPVQHASHQALVAEP